MQAAGLVNNGAGPADYSVDVLQKLYRLVQRKLLAGRTIRPTSSPPSHRTDYLLILKDY